MAEKNQMSLMKKVNTLCNNSYLNELYLNANNSSTYIKSIQLTIREELTSHQYNLKRNNKKLKFYSIFQNNCHKSDCLNIITNITYKKTLNKFRFGNHRLQIETGRHTAPKTPENLRICPFCHLNKVEHELHFLFNCNLYDSLRSNFYRNIINRYPLFNNFDNNGKPASYLIMSIFISTDLQLLTYIHVWNIDKKLFFNYSPYFHLRFIT